MVGIDVTENFIHRLFSNSPFLERFSLSESYEIKKLEIVSAPNLNFLVLRMCHYLRHLEISSAKNLNTMGICDALSLKSINISFAPNLSHLILGIQNKNFKFDPYLTLLDQINKLTLQMLVAHYFLFFLFSSLIS